MISSWCKMDVVEEAETLLHLNGFTSLSVSGYNHTLSSASFDINSTCHFEKKGGQKER